MTEVMIDPGLLSPAGNTDDVTPWGRVSIADPGEQDSEPGEIETQARHLPLTDLPVDWFDQADDDPWSPSNNDLDPTQDDDLDYSPWWDTEREWDYPHPMMEGYVCSTGYRHEPRQRQPVAPVGLARINMESSDGA